MSLPERFRLGDAATQNAVFNRSSEHQTSDALAAEEAVTHCLPLPMLPEPTLNESNIRPLAFEISCAQFLSRQR